LSGTPAHLTETTILSKYIAGHIEECSKGLGIEPCDLTWNQFRRHIEYYWGTQRKNHTEGDERVKSLTPNHITQAGGFNKIRDSFFPKKATQIQVERARLGQIAGYNRKLGAHFAEQEFVKESLEQFAERVFAGMAKSRGVPPKAKKISRNVTVVLSDTHFGSDISSEETGVLTYGKIEEARRLAKIAKEVVSYKPQYRDQTTLEVLFLGDMIEGILHNMRDGADLAEQCARAIKLLTQFVTYVAAHYPQVNVRCATGNHGRDKYLHHGRATSKKYDSNETVIYYAVKYACANLENVQFFLPKTPYVSYEVLGHRFYATHGDTNLNPGNPGAAIPIRSLENQTNKINAALTDKDEYACFIVGHVHVGSITYLNNGAVMLTNGALPPPSPFAVNLSIMESNAGQFLFETVEGYPVGDTRFIRVDSETDKDASLDEIITPFTSFED
jgi:hypothetical protein